jgi:hypothetical protein
MMKPISRCDKKTTTMASIIGLEVLKYTDPALLWLGR